MTAVGNQLFIYAGAPKQGGMLGDLWELDLAKAEWSEIDADGQMPHVRCSHGAAPSGQSVYFFGGSYYRYCLGYSPAFVRPRMVSSIIYWSNAKH